MHRSTALMSYRDLLTAINQDLLVRDDSRLEGPVVVGVLDARGGVHFGHLVSFSVGAVPDGQPTVASPPGPRDAFCTSVPRVDSIASLGPSEEDDGALTRVVDVDELTPAFESVLDPDPEDFSAASDRTCILDIRSMPRASAWARLTSGEEEHTVYARRPADDSRFDEETTTIRDRSPSATRSTSRDTVVSSAIGPERRPHCARLSSRSQP